MVFKLDETHVNWVHGCIETIRPWWVNKQIKKQIQSFITHWYQVDLTLSFQLEPHELSLEKRSHYVAMSCLHPKAPLCKEILLMFQKKKRCKSYLVLIQFEREQCSEFLFKACRRSLRLEGGGIFHAQGVTHCKNQSPLLVWATPLTNFFSKLAFNLIVRDNHHPVNELWVLLQ